MVPYARDSCFWREAHPDADDLQLLPLSPPYGTGLLCTESLVVPLATSAAQTIHLFGIRRRATVGRQFAFATGSLVSPSGRGHPPRDRTSSHDWHAMW